MLKFEQAVLDAGAEVYNVLSAFQATSEKITVRNLQFEAANNSVYFMEELLKAGDANYTEVINARENLLSAQLNEINDKLSLLLYSVNLYRVLGGVID